MLKEGLSFVFFNSSSKNNMRDQFEMNIYLIHKRIIQKTIVEVI